MTIGMPQDNCIPYKKYSFIVFIKVIFETVLIKLVVVEYDILNLSTNSGFLISSFIAFLNKLQMYSKSNSSEIISMFFLSLCETNISRSFSALLLIHTLIIIFRDNEM